MALYRSEVGTRHYFRGAVQRVASCDCSSFVKMQLLHLSEGKQAMAAERPVLIVEDDEALRETLVEQLAEDGEFVAILAASIEEAEAKLAQNDARFDVIILDINLPDGDGRELCARLRKKGHGVPVIMLTGSADDGD